MAGLDFGPAPAVLSQGFTMPPAPTGGMFGGGKFGLKEAIAMGLAGFVSRRNPQLLQGLMQALLYKQKMQADEQQYQRERQDKRDEFTFEQDYKAQHPDMPDIAQRIATLNGIEPGLGSTYARNYANNGGGSMIQFVDPATGQRYGMSPGANLPAIGTVMDDPRKAGGQTPPASGNFPY